MTNITINSLPTYSGTVDHTNDILPIYDASTTSTVGVSINNLLTLSSQPVGISDSQTLTNKVLTSPTISGPTFSGTLIGTYTIGGTPTFPASVVTLTGSQTLTNKVLTSPTINSATISNPTLTVDTISGYSNASNVTAGGVTLQNGAVGGTTGTFSGLLTASNGFTISSGTVTLQDGSVGTKSLTNPIKFSVYRAAAQNTGASADALVAFDTKTGAAAFDTGGNVDVVTNKGRFTAPVAGFYWFSSHVSCASGAYLLPSIYKNGSLVKYGGENTSSGGSTSSYVTELLQLAANDYIEIFCQANIAKAIDTGPINTYFSGFLVSKT